MMVSKVGKPTVPLLLLETSGIRLHRPQFFGILVFTWQQLVVDWTPTSLLDDNGYGRDVGSKGFTMLLLQPVAISSFLILLDLKSNRLPIGFWNEHAQCLGFVPDYSLADHLIHKGSSPCALACISSTVSWRCIVQPSLLASPTQTIGSAPVRASTCPHVLAWYVVLSS